jgi:hypothetical protein
MPYNREMRSSPASARDAFVATLDLFETGVALMRQNLRRADPVATDNDINLRLHRWLRQRPGAEAGDSVGRPIDLDGPAE